MTGPSRKNIGTPFYFDSNVFDQSLGANKDDEKTQLKFTDDDLRAARDLAYQEGKKAGFQEGEASRVRDILNVIQAINSALPVLHAAEQSRESRYEAECIHLSCHIVDTLYPLFAQSFGLQTLKDAIKTTLENYKDTAPVTIEMHPEIFSSVKTYFSSPETPAGAKIEFKENPDLPSLGCHVIWPHGGAMIHHAEIAGKIRNILQETLAEHNITVHDESHNKDNQTLSGGDSK